MSLNKTIFCFLFLIGLIFVIVIFGLIMLSSASIVKSYQKNGSSYLINYRYSTLEVFNKLGIRFGVSASPEYQDVSYKVNVPTKKAGIFTLWGIGGKSNARLQRKAEMVEREFR